MKLPNLSEVEKRFSPVYWGYTSSIPEKAYKAVCPTVSELDELYGSGSSSYWINVQITALFGSSSNRDVELICGIKLFSDSFASQVGIYKLSELMLFFSRYKAGTYDNSYSTFDTRRIGGAFLKNFFHSVYLNLQEYNAKIIIEIFRKKRTVEKNICDL